MEWANSWPIEFFCIDEQSFYSSFEQAEENAT